MIGFEIDAQLRGAAAACFQALAGMAGWAKTPIRTLMEAAYMTGAMAERVGAHVTVSDEAGIDFWVIRRRVGNSPDGYPWYLRRTAAGMPLWTTWQCEARLFGSRADAERLFRVADRPGLEPAFVEAVPASASDGRHLAGDFRR